MAETPPQIEIVGLLKQFQAPQPLRIDQLVVRRLDRIVLKGLDAAASELFVHLVTGAALPDEGNVLVAGRNTRDIATDTEWLSSLDRFGIVTDRAVLLDGLSVAANLALPLTLSIDPLADDVRQQVDALAEGVGLDRNLLESPMGNLPAADRLRVHLARALALAPELLLLEHPTAKLEAPEADSFGRLLGAIAAERGLGFVATSFDERFARAAGARRLRFDPSTGQVRGGGFWRAIWG
jgi:ABC-type lipoprotein export system ATPase subunit